MLSAGEIKKGTKLDIDGAPWLVTEAQFVKPGKGQAFQRMKMKNLITGATLDRTMKIVEKVEEAMVEEHQMQYLYNDGTDFHFMNSETFEQITISAKVLDDATKWLVEEMLTNVLFYQGRAVTIDLPNFVELQIEYTEPGMKGNTAQGATKTARLTTGAEVQVPLFVDQEEWLKIDTRTGQYVERVKR